MLKTNFQAGDRARFADGQVGTIAALVNGGTLVKFTSDNGAKFTARADEVAALEAAKPVDHPPGMTGRTIYVLDAADSIPRTQRQRAQQPQGRAVSRPIVDDHGRARPMTDAEIRRFAEDDDAFGHTSGATRARDASRYSCADCGATGPHFCGDRA